MAAGTRMRAVFFDGDQTLWDFQLLMRRALRATIERLRRLRPDLAAPDLEAFVADRDAAAAELGPGADLERLRLNAFVRTLRRVGIEDVQLASQLNACYAEHRFAGIELYPDVLPALESLRGRVLIGLLSNGNGYPQQAGLRFDAVVFSDDHGIAKPDRRIFDLAARSLGVEPEECVMVGDSLVNDVAGAQRAGWSGIWLDRAGSPVPQGFEPDAVIGDLRILPRLLA